MILACRQGDILPVIYDGNADLYLESSSNL